VAKIKKIDENKHYIDIFGALLAIQKKANLRNLLPRLAFTN